MEENLLLIERKDHIATLIFNRPEKRNALSPLMLFQFADTLKQLKEEGEVRCLVIRGAGDKAFSAGYDISELPTNLTPEKAKVLKGKNPFRIGLQALIDFPYPVIAMLNGHAFGGGGELATACDIRIAAATARLSMPPAKLGIVYHWAGIIRFINIVGLANAKEIFFTGRAYEASRAREMGWVNYVVPPDQLASFTYQMAQEISENAPLSLMGLKMIFHKCLEYQKIDPQTAEEMESLRDRAFRSEDLLEGQRAFMEKRKPVFKGR
ncbi:MAG: enoyl-CoA hydratase-related protein [Thermodesulfobacteriota bacterium]|jgi:enoyl-CoA hydratase/carnithine racemase